MTLRRQCAVIIGRIHPFDTEAQEDVHTRSTDTIPRLPHVTLHTLARCSTQLADDAHGNFGRITRGRHEMSRALLLRHMREGRMRLVKCERLPSHVYGRPGLKREASCHCQQNQTTLKSPANERTQTSLVGRQCDRPRFTRAQSSRVWSRPSAQSSRDTSPPPTGEKTYFLRFLVRISS